jgi:hypothetical protein
VAGRHARRTAGAVLGAAVLVAVAGCHADDITSYDVPRGEPKVRLLAGIVPQAQRTWFFKLSGPVDEVGPQEQAFVTFLSSVRPLTAEAAEGAAAAGGAGFVAYRVTRTSADADPPLNWTLPADWKKGPDVDAPGRVATFEVGPREKPLDVSVNVFPGEAGSVLANINRWRGQIGLLYIAAEDQDQVARNLDLPGLTVLKVDMAGPGSSRPSTRPGPAGGPPAGQPDKPDRSRPKYQLPDGWKEHQPTDGFALVAFTAGKGDDAAEVTVTPVGGTLEDNVARWRGQLGLGPATAQQIARDVRAFDVGDVHAFATDLTGTDVKTRGPARILAVLVPRGGAFWVLRMKGRPDAVEKQKSAFEAFARSVSFDDVKGTN